MSFLTDKSSGAHAITLVGNAALDATQGKFDGSCLALPAGAARWASVPDSTDWDFGASPFTIELHVQFTTVTAEYVLISQFDNSSGHYWTCGKYNASGVTPTLYFAYITGGSTYQTIEVPAPSFVAGQWYHLAVDRDASNDFRIYCDGVVLGTTNLTTSLATSTYTVSIGGAARWALDIGDTTGVYDVDGYIDEVRITKGVARYAGAFTAPTVAYPNDVAGDPSFASVVLLAHFNSAVEGILLEPLALEAWMLFPTYGAATLQALGASGWSTVIVGNAQLPLLDAAGVAMRSYPMNGNTFLPEFDSAGSLEAALPLPALQADAAVGLNGNVGAGAVTLARLVSGGSLEGALKLAQLNVAGVLLGGARIDGAAVLAQLGLTASLEAALALPALAMAATLIAGGTASGAIVLAALDAHGVSGPAGNAVLAPLTAGGVLRAGNLGNGDATLARPSMAAVLYQNNSAAGAARLEPLGALGVAISSARSDGDARLAAPTLAAVMLAGNISGAVTVELALLAVDADGYASAIGSAVVRLPLLALDARMTGALAAPVFTGVVLHTRSANAVTTYSGADFNSLCSFNGLLLAASSTGIYALTGDSDAGLPITAVLASGVADFQSEQFKRVLAGYAGYSADGDLELTIATDGARQHVYALTPRRPGVLHAARVKFGRGVDGRYWQWRLSNRAGAAFALDALTLDAVALSRRIG